MDTQTRRCILEEAQSWLGTPFHHKGRVKGVGCDCGGFIYEVFGKFVPSIKPFPKSYAEDWSVHQGQELYLNFVQKYFTRTNKPQIGDIAVFKFGRCFSHGAIHTGDGRYIHAWGRTEHGCVQISSREFFNIRYRGIRPCLDFTLEDEWLH